MVKRMSKNDSAKKCGNYPKTKVEVSALVSNFLTLASDHGKKAFDLSSYKHITASMVPRPAAILHCKPMIAALCDIDDSLCIAYSDIKAALAVVAAQTTSIIGSDPGLVADTCMVIQKHARWLARDLVEHGLSSMVEKAAAKLDQFQAGALRQLVAKVKLGDGPSLSPSSGSSKKQLAKQLSEPDSEWTMDSTGVFPRLSQSTDDNDDSNDDLSLSIAMHDLDDDKAKLSKAIALAGLDDKQVLPTTKRAIKSVIKKPASKKSTSAPKPGAKKAAGAGSKKVGGSTTQRGKNAKSSKKLASGWLVDTFVRSASDKHAGATYYEYRSPKGILYRSLKQATQAGFKPEKE